MLELGPALLSQPGEPEHAAHAAVVERAGGAVKAWAEQRALSLELPELKKHCDWEKTARPALKLRENAMAYSEALLQLDYGGLNDSANDKVSVWSATVMAKDREQEHFDFFFNQTSSKSEPTLTNGKAKKDGQTGFFSWRSCSIQIDLLSKTV